MARLKMLKIGVINIKTQPHSTDNYSNLLNSTYKLAEPGKIRGSDWGMIGSLRRNKIDEDEYVLFGSFYKFLNIDPRCTWLDLKQRTPVNAEEDGLVPPVPDFLKPNLKKIFYIFYPHLHRLFFETSNITPSSLRKLLIALFSSESIFNKFGQVDVEIESTKELIQKIMDIPRLTRLSIDFSFPNNDTLDEADKKVLDRFRERNVRRHKQVSTTTDPDGIQIDKETQSLMNIGRSNGNVAAVGYEGEKRLMLSTRDHPLEYEFKFDTDHEIKYDAMLMVATAMINQYSFRR